jgi:predicted Rossmann-fold nucleotide-binding protein
MEEFFEVLCWGYLGLHPKPMGLLNVNGYYDPLIEFLDRSVDAGLTRARARELLAVGQEPAALLDLLLAGIGPAAD